MCRAPTICIGKRRHYHRCFGFIPLCVCVCASMKRLDALTASRVASGLEVLPAPSRRPASVVEAPSFSIRRLFLEDHSGRRMSSKSQEPDKSRDSGLGIGVLS